MRPMQGRLYCYRCMRVKRMCLCGAFATCENQTEIHVLQHQRERKHAFGTVRLLKIALEELVVHRMPVNKGQGYTRPEGFPAHAGLLYPGPGSTNLEELAPQQRPKKLVVIDGTWNQAHCMYRDSPWLQRLPRYALHPEEPSRYRIRKEPRHECLSTLESTAMALRLLEPDTVGIDNLLHTFERMVDAQLDCIEVNSGGPRRMKRAQVRPMRAVPSVIWQEPERVVVVYGESGLPRSRREKQHRELAQWSAVRLLNSEQVFDGIVVSDAMPEGFFLEELGWSHNDLARAESKQSLQERWRHFVKPTDVLVAWNKGTGRLAGQHDLAVGNTLTLKQSYGNTVVGHFGTLEQVVEREQLCVRTALPIAGRASRRLVNAQAAAIHLGRWARNRLEKTS